MRIRFIKDKRVWDFPYSVTLYRYFLEDDTITDLQIVSPESAPQSISSDGPDREG